MTGFGSASTSVSWISTASMTANVITSFGSMTERGRAEGIALGRAETFDITIKIIQLNLQGKSPQEIANLCNLRVEEVVKYLETLSSLPKSET